jgi:hypothetical protein
MSDTILGDRILSSSAFSHTIDVPIEEVDIADWLFHLPEAEYRHNRRETPLFAESIARKAKARS